MLKELVGKTIPCDAVRSILSALPGATNLYASVMTAFPGLIVLGKDTTISSHTLRVSKNDLGEYGNSFPIVNLGLGFEGVSEALVHELLHFEVACRGYPKFVYYRGLQRCENTIKSIINVAEHALMKQWFLGYGCDERRFLAVEPDAKDLAFAKSIENAFRDSGPSSYAEKVGRILDQRVERQDFK